MVTATYDTIFVQVTWHFISRRCWPLVVVVVVVLLLLMVVCDGKKMDLRRRNQ